ADLAIVEANDRGDDADEVSGQVHRTVVTAMFVLADRGAVSVCLVELRRGSRRVMLRRAISLQRDGERPVDVDGRALNDDAPSSRVGLNDAEVMRSEKGNDGLNIFCRRAMPAHVFFGREELSPVRRRILPMVEVVFFGRAGPRSHTDCEPDTF